jgi:hypothetical protein
MTTTEFKFTDEYMLALGLELEQDETCYGMERGVGKDRRGLTNIEMSAILFLATWRKYHKGELQPC